MRTPRGAASTRKRTAPQEQPPSYGGGRLEGLAGICPPLERSHLHAHPAEKIDLAEFHAACAQEVVGGRRVEIKVWEREGEQEVLRREGKLVLAEMEDRVLALAGVERVRRHFFEARLRVVDELLKIGIGVRAGVLGRLRRAALGGLDGAQRVLRNGRDLETEGQHVVDDARLDDLVRGDALLLAEGRALFQEAGDGAERLQ